MVVVMFLKNGKTWKSNNNVQTLEDIEKQPHDKCPYDNADLRRIYEYIDYTGAITEIPEDFLPKSFKQTKLDSIAIMECPTCQKRFIMWENNDYSEVEFHEVKLLPDGNYSREGEAVNTEDLKQAGMQESTREWLKNGKEDCDCGENHGKCDGSCHNSQNTKPFRPSFYG